MRYAQLAQREIEYVALSKDITDSDLKQRREILSGSAFYTDGPAVKAALNGRILVLDGIEASSFAFERFTGRLTTGNAMDDVSPPAATHVFYISNRKQNVMCSQC